MKFWLTCFVLLFAGAELFQWLVTLGGEGLSGAGLVLGGMGLAAASNAKHLPRLVSTQTPKEKGLSEQTGAGKTGAGKTGAGKTGGDQPATAARQPIEQQTRQTIAHKDTATTAPSATAPRSSVATSDEDSISFKVRLPWR